MVIAVFPVLVAVVGLLVWVLAGNTVLKEVGKWCFIVGLFWTVAGMATKTVKVGDAGSSIERSRDVSLPRAVVRAPWWRVLGARECPIRPVERRTSAEIWSGRPAATRAPGPGKPTQV